MMDPIADPSAFRAWDRAMEWPLMAVAVVFATAYAWQILGDPQGGTLLFTQILALGSWAVFAVDYVVRLFLVGDRRKWFLRNLLSLLLVVLPILQSLRLICLLTLFTVFRQAAGSALRGQVVMYASSAVLLVLSPHSRCMTPSTWLRTQTSRLSVAPCGGPA